MPTYKRDIDLVKPSILSLVNQTYENIEVIIVDDSPEDYPTRDKIEELVASFHDPRFIYLKNQVNMGGALARNEGIKISTGEYISFLDDDDTYLPEKIENQVNFMEDGHYDLSFSNLTIQNENGQTIDVRNFPGVPVDDQDEFLKYHLMRHATGTPTFMFKRQAIFDIGLFDDAIMGQEFYLMLKAIEGGLKIGYLDSYDVLVLRHSGEAISVGPNKIKGEKILYNKKKEYFYLFNASQRRFIKMRHYAVMAVASYRNGDYSKFFAYAFRAFFTAPISMLAEAIKLWKSQG